MGGDALQSSGREDPKKVSEDGHDETGQSSAAVKKANGLQPACACVDLNGARFDGVVD